MRRDEDLGCRCLLTKELPLLSPCFSETFTNHLIVNELTQNGNIPPLRRSFSKVNRISNPKAHPPMVREVNFEGLFALPYKVIR